MYVWKHLKTITKHRTLVMIHCFKIGLYWQGLTHDLSKYSPTEFMAGARYYQGIKSPNVAEREDKGYSTAWIHHKGRNRHHMEYWTDLKVGTRTYVPIPMPPQYLAEMCMDRMAACKTYRGKAYTDSSAIDYLNMSREAVLMHPETMRKLTYILELLRDKGEQETFRFIRQTLLKGKEF